MYIRTPGTNNMSSLTKTSIYKVVCKDLTIKDTFVGSSRNLSSTIRDYKVNISNGAKQKPDEQYMFATVKANGGFAKWDLILIEEFTYTNRHELIARIRHHVETLGATLNQPLPADMQPLATTPTCPCNSFVPNPKNKFHLQSAQHLNYLRALAESKAEAALPVAEPEPATSPHHLLTSSPEVEALDSATCICGAKLKNLNNKIHLNSARHLKFVLQQLQQPSLPSNGN